MLLPRKDLCLTGKVNLRIRFLWEDDCHHEMKLWASILQRATYPAIVYYDRDAQQGQRTPWVIGYPMELPYKHLCLQQKEVWTYDHTTPLFWNQKNKERPNIRKSLSFAQARSQTYLNFVKDDKICIYLCTDSISDSSV